MKPPPPGRRGRRWAGAVPLPPGPPNASAPVTLRSACGSVTADSKAGARRRRDGAALRSRFSSGRDAGEGRRCHCAASGSPVELRRGAARRRRAGSCRCGGNLHGSGKARGERRAQLVLDVEQVVEHAVRAIAERDRTGRDLHQAGGDPQPISQTLNRAVHEPGHPAPAMDVESVTGRGPTVAVPVSIRALVAVSVSVAGEERIEAVIRAVPDDGDAGAPQVGGNGLGEAHTDPVVDRPCAHVGERHDDDGFGGLCRCRQPQGTEEQVRRDHCARATACVVGHESSSLPAVPVPRVGECVRDRGTQVSQVRVSSGRGLLLRPATSRRRSRPDSRPR